MRVRLQVVSIAAEHKTPNQQLQCKGHAKYYVQHQTPQILIYSIDRLTDLTHFNKTKTSKPPIPQEIPSQILAVNLADQPTHTRQRPKVKIPPFHEPAAHRYDGQSPYLLLKYLLS